MQRFCFSPSKKIQKAQLNISMVGDHEEVTIVG